MTDTRVVHPRGDGDELVRVVVHLPRRIVVQLDALKRAGRSRAAVCRDLLDGALEEAS
jgi:hypothetical protein